MAQHFFTSLAQAGRMAIHVEATGRDPHHTAEAAYKAVGRAVADRGARRVGWDPVDEGRLMKVAVCDYRAGNIRSVEIALRRLGAEMVDDIASADLRRAPGKTKRLRARRWRSCVRRGTPNAAAAERMADNKPVLGICLGLQLAVEWSEEDGGVDGLGLLPGKAVRLREGRVPRIGWAEVDGAAYYFAHSYAVETPCATATSEGIVAEARSGSFLGVQFHPEKSGAAGARYLDRVLAEVREQSLSRA